MDGPFNITLGGVLWKVVNPRITKLVENSSDPSSEDYLSISTSWELGFSNYNLLLLDNNEKNIASAEVISEPDQIEKYKGYLKAFGGSGTIDGGKKIYRKIIDKVVPLGVGITETPAADVKGILTIKPEQDMKVEASEAVEHKVMKINAISDITDESLKQVSASVISDFISEEIKKASDQFEIEKNQSQEAIKASIEKADSLTKELEALKAEYEKVNQVLAEIQKENEAKAKQELFNQRMAGFDGEFELSSEEREIIAGDISEMGEDAFAAYKKKMGVLLKGKKPAPVAQEVSEKGKVMASANASEVSDAVENAIDNAVVNDNAIPNSSQASESLVDKYKKAFSVEGFEVQL
jgi:hypothetical protein